MNDAIYMKLDVLAEQAGDNDLKKTYNDVRVSIQKNVIKRYVILGDVNSGKSTIVNIFAGKRNFPFL